MYTALGLWLMLFSATWQATRADVAVILPHILQAASYAKSPVSDHVSPAGHVQPRSDIITIEGSVLYRPGTSVVRANPNIEVLFLATIA